jgi:hypothetical protein
MIIAKLMGGLGNQMFQYAIGKNLALKNKTILFLDISHLKHKCDAEANNFTNRNFYLNYLNIDANLASDKLINRVYNKRKGISRFFYKDYKLVKEIRNEFNKSILDNGNNIILEGYWQSDKYFSEINHIIKNEFVVKTPLIGANKDIYESICKTLSVSIHIRRGDYVMNPLFSEVIGALPVEYYQNAVEYFERSILDPIFYVFSDDINWAKRNLTFIKKKYFVDQNKEETCYEDLRLMSACKHNIIANSSFSWWASYLNKNGQKIVIAPEKWFNNPDLCNKNMIPETWIRV